MKNFLSLIKKFKKHREKTGNRVNVLQVGTDPKGWLLIYCPSKNPHEEGRYYAASLASGKTISSTQSSIRQAYRIDPITGEVEYHPSIGERATNADEEKGAPRVFAVKDFSSPELKQKAENEARALGRHQFVDYSFDELGRPIVISDFYPGGTICDDEGKPNQALLKNLSLKDRVFLILQIANQYYAMQKHSTPHIHVDIKGPNVIVNPPNDVDGSQNAYLIDFGSVKELGNEGTVETSLSGLTACAVPFEAVNKLITLGERISGDRKERVLEINERFADETQVFSNASGTLSGKSDVYAMAPIFASLLGAESPYRYRMGEIRTVDGKIDLQVVGQQILIGFDYRGVLDSLPEVKFSFASEKDCAFKNLHDEEAPNDNWILEKQKYGEENFEGYILFKDQLLFVDKQNKKVLGRKSERGYLRDFEAKCQGWAALESTDSLEKDVLSQLVEYTPGFTPGSVRIEDLLKENVTAFLNRMSDLDESNRPDIEIVLQYFTSLSKILVLASCDARSKGNHDFEREIQVNLLKLNCLFYNAWDIKIQVIGLPGEEVKDSYLRHFDFSILEDDNEEANSILDDLNSTFSNEDILKWTRPLNADDFKCISMKSEAKQFYDNIVSRLTVLQLERSRQASLNEKIQSHLLFWKSDSKTKSRFSEFSGQFLSLPPVLMCLILEESLDEKQWSRFDVMKSYLENRDFLKDRFPEFIKKVQAKLKGIDTQNTCIKLDAMMVEKTGVGRTILEIISFFKNDPPLEENIIKNKILNLLKNREGNSIDKSKLIELLSDIERFKENIVSLTTKENYASLRTIVTEPLLADIKGYIAGMEKYDRNSYRVSFFNLGGFGFKVGEKLDAAKALVEAFETGNYDSLLKNRSHLAALKQKTLGRLSKHLLENIKQLHQGNQQSMGR